MASRPAPLAPEDPGYDVEAGAFDLVMTILERLTPAERTRVMTRACLWAEVP